MLTAKRCATTFGLLYLLTTMVGAEELCDTVFLKDGGVIAGKVVAWMPGQAVKLQASDGQYVFRLDDVERTAFHTLEEDSPAFEIKKSVEEMPAIPAEFVIKKEPPRMASLKARHDSLAQVNRREDFMQRHFLCMAQFSTGIEYSQASFLFAIKRKGLSSGLDVGVRVAPQCNYYPYCNYYNDSRYTASLSAFFDLRYTGLMGRKGVYSFALRPGVTHSFAAQLCCQIGGNIGSSYLLGGVTVEYQLSDGHILYGFDLPNGQSLVLGATLSVLF